MTDLPTRIMAGDSIEATRAHAGYTDADGWSLSLVLTSAAAQYEFAATPNGDQWDVAVTPAQTANLSAGEWTMLEVASKGATSRVTLSRAPLFVDPDATAGPADLRSHAEQMVAAIEAVLEGRATQGDIDLVQATGTSTSIQREGVVAGLYALRDKYRAEVRTEERKRRIAAGLGSGRFIGVQFR